MKWLPCLLLLALSPLAEAHVSSTGFLRLEAHGHALAGSMELAVRDVELAVGVDANNDAKVTWGELRAAEPRLSDYLNAHLQLTSDGRPCPLHLDSMKVNRRIDGAYAWLQLAARCLGDAGAVTIHYDALQDVDPSHRALLTFISSTGAVQTSVLGGTSAGATLALGTLSRWHTFADYLQVGIGHIWGGIDHLLFLLSLLLPAVLIRRGDRWEPVPRIRPAAFNILKIVTAFTIAHSITLSLAAFDIVHLPSRLTESVIAGSIIVAALNNIFPLVTESRARIAFGFGLLHGFGFASVLSEMGLPSGARLLSLVAFNLGIEIGQLAVVLAVMPIAYVFRVGPLYRRALLPAGSALIALVAAVWFVQRAFLV